MSFSEALFPLEVSAWATGGRGFNTSVIETDGGNTFRNAIWSQALGEWDVGEALRSTNEASTYAVKALRKFIMAGKGQLSGFRFRDPQDHTDEGGGIFVMIDATHFQCYKTYTITSLTYNQIIQKPVSTITVTGGTVSSVDYTTGIVTMTSGTPTAWTGTFDIPVAFAGDMPNIGLDGTGAFFSWQQIKLVEIRL